MEQQGESFVRLICSGLPALPILPRWNITLLRALLCLGTFSVSEFVGPMILLSTGDNLFPVPYGRVSTQFISELLKLFSHYGCASIALQTAMLMPALLLQRPSWKSKPHDHIAYLERHLPLWLDGDVNALLAEGVTIQQQLRHSCSFSSCDDMQVFAQEKVRTALWFSLMLLVAHSSFCISMRIYCVWRTH